MLSKEALNEIEQWRRQTVSPQQQLDRRWLERYRELASYDGHWWLGHAGPFSEQEQQQWDQLSASPTDEHTRDHLSQLLVQSRERELATALAEQREPHLSYPAIDIADVRRRLTAFQYLDEEIAEEEPHPLVRHLYHGAIEEELDFLHLIEACYEGDTAAFWRYNCHLDPVPTVQEMERALACLKQIVAHGLRTQTTREVSNHILHILHTQFTLSLDLSADTASEQEIQQPARTHSPGCRVTAQTAQRFLEAVLHECGYEGWRVTIDSNALNARVEQGLRCVFLADEAISIERMRHILAHELAGHVARCVAGSHSPIGLLGINTYHALPTEEGFALYYERQAAALVGEPFNDWGTWVGAMTIGLASGVVTPPQTFRSLMPFLEALHLLHRLLEGLDDTIQQAQKRARNQALARCLRTFRGVPNLETAGICYSKDIVYLRGLSLVEQAAKEDPTILERLAVGVISLRLLPDLQELKLIPLPPLVRKLAYDPELESRILSFELPEEEDQHLQH